jgi:hypothetical protein
MWALPAHSAIKGRSSSSPERSALGASPPVPRFGPRGHRRRPPIRPRGIGAKTSPGAKTVGFELKVPLCGAQAWETCAWR